MFILSLPSAALTLDIIVEEVDAPLEDGALLLPSLDLTGPLAALYRVVLPCLSLPDAHRGLPIQLRRFPGSERQPSHYRPAAYAGTLYDATTLPFGRLYAFRSDNLYAPSFSMYSMNLDTPFRWDALFPHEPVS